MPDPIQQTGQTTSTPPPDTTTQQTPSTQQTTQQTAPDTNVGGQQQATQQIPVAQTAPSFRDSISKFGFDASRYQTDEEAMRALVEQNRLAQSQQHFAQLGQQVFPRYGEFQKFLEQQQAAADAEKAKQAKWWDAPKYDPTWENRIQRNATTGELELKPGASPDALVNYQRFRDHVAQTNIKFAQDPIGMMKPGLEPMIREITQALIKEQLGGFQQQQTIEQLHRRDSGWLYEQDAKGQVRYGADNQPVRSIAGEFMDKHIVRLQQSGLKNNAELWELARELTWASLEKAKQQGTVPQQQQQTPPPNGNGVNRLANLGNTDAAVNGVAQGTNNGGSLGDKLRAAMKNGGITNESFA